MEFWLKDGIAPVSQTLSLSRASFSLSSGSRPPPQPATFWPAVQSSGHHSGRDRSQNDRPDSAVLPQPVLTASRRDFAGKSKKTARFRLKLRRLRSPSSGHRFRQVRYDFSPIFRALADGWVGFHKF
ncbi:unnamed protein product [Prunus armeniaca]